MSYRKSSDESCMLNCGCFSILIAFNLLIGGWSVNYLLQFFLGKTIPLLGAAVIGLFVAELSVPVAIVVAILQLFGIL